MSPRTIVVALLALICAGSAMFAVNQIITARPTPTEVNTVPVVIAARDMPRGSQLSEASLTVQQWQAEHAPAGALQSIEQAKERSTMTPIFRGEPILDNKLASRESGRGLASMIEPGMRAFTIQTPHVSAGVGGFLMPDDKVDVLLTTTGGGPDDRTGGGATTTLLQNVTVMAVAQRLDAPETNTVELNELKSVTLLVTPDQAAKLDLGMNKGVLHLSLRNPEDTDEATTMPATMAQLRFHQETPNDGSGEVATTDQASTVVPTRTTEIRTLRGVARGVVRVEVPR